MPHEPLLCWDGFEYRDVQDEHGVDLELLRANRRLTVAQRIEQHRRSLESILRLKNATRALRPRENR